MDKPVTSDPTGNTDAVEVESDAITRVFGADLWLRFDMWAGRSWETSQRAMELAEQGSVPISADDMLLDPRVAAMFHAAETAKEFAEMCNPLTVLGLVDGDTTTETVVTYEPFPATLTGNEDD